MQFSMISLCFVVASAAAFPSPASVTPAVEIQERQLDGLGESIRNSVSSQIASRMSSVSSAAEDRSSSLSAAAESRSSSLATKLSGISSSVASVTLNHPTQAFSSGTASGDCNGVFMEINGAKTCCDGPVINNKCYNLSSAINGGTQTPTFTQSSEGNSNSDSNSNSGSDSDSDSNNSNSGNNDDNGAMAVLIQPAVSLMGAFGAAFLIL